MISGNRDGGAFIVYMGDVIDLGARRNPYQTICLISRKGTKVTCHYYVYKSRFVTSPLRPLFYICLFLASLRSTLLSALTFWYGI